MSRLFLLACCALLLSACSHGHPDYRDVPFYLTQDFLSRPPQPVEEPKGFPICWRNGITDDTACVAALIYDLPTLGLDKNSSEPYLLMERINLRTGAFFGNMSFDVRNPRGAFTYTSKDYGMYIHDCAFDETNMAAFWYKDGGDGPLDSSYLISVVTK